MTPRSRSTAPRALRSVHPRSRSESKHIPAICEQPRAEAEVAASVTTSAGITVEPYTDCPAVLRRADHGYGRGAHHRSVAHAQFAAGHSAHQLQDAGSTTAAGSGGASHPTPRLYHRRMNADLSSLVCGSTVFADALAVADWVGAGRPTTAGGALKPASVPELAGCLRLRCPAQVRRASDAPMVHRRWLVAMAAGLITRSGARAVRVEPAPEPGAREWLAALEDVVREQVHDPCQADARIVCQVTLATVTAHRVPIEDLPDLVGDTMRARGDWDYHSHGLERSPRHPVNTVVEILREFGALDHRLSATPLAEYARDELGRRVPPPMDADLPAAALLAVLARLPEAESWKYAQRWLAAQRFSGTGPLRELLNAAETASPAGRLLGVEIVSAYDVPGLWKEVLEYGMLGPHARFALAEGSPALDERILHWIVVDSALADLERFGVVDARYTLLGAGADDIVASVRASGHPDSDELLAAIGADWPPIPAYQLKIALSGRVWRRVRVPANMSLGELHHAIQVLFNWSGDHLHVFDAAGRRYADPFFDLDDCGDEYAYRVNRALPAPTSTITYTYDLGDCHRHEITLERIDSAEIAHPVCVDGRGDHPLEDYNPDYPEDPVPFVQDTVNHQLRTLAGAEAR
ncbi:plasmid pRiA4b ORF-3 family protein [Nocardia sp. NPDC101769]|uniref:plasmid pRiA4b ORF-3 family protein n=1 Tax=Nocardia sp. NPDC101769 TaxID=3364333 RepID=UPI00382535E3